MRGDLYLYGRKHGKMIGIGADRFNSNDQFYMEMNLNHEILTVLRVKYINMLKHGAI